MAATRGAAAMGGIVGALTAIAVPEEEACYYQALFEAGRTIVTVQAPGRQREAWKILQSNGAHDVTARPDTSASNDTNGSHDL